MKKVVCLFLVLLTIFALPDFSEAKSKKKTTKSSKKTAAKTDLPLLKVENRLTISGGPLASKEQAVNFIKKSNPKANLNCSVEEIVELYYQEAEREGIRPDIALSQALLETGFFKYGGDVKASQNNFCGLGSVGGGVKGASFKTPELGVRAHIQHLLAYSSKQPPKTKIVDPRYDLVKSRPDIFGVCVTWHDLDGRWAAKGVPYGQRILSIHDRLLETEPKNSLVIIDSSKKGETEQEKNSKAKETQAKVREKIEQILREKAK